MVPRCGDGRMSQRISLMWSMMPVFFWSWTKRSNCDHCLELERQPRGRQLLEHHRPVARVAGVLAVPVRRRRRQRQQVRVLVEQRGDDRHHLVRRGDPDVHVHAPDQHLTAPPLGALDQLGVARRVGELLPPTTPRTGGCPRRTAPSRGRARPAATVPSVPRRSSIASAGVVADAGDDLDGVAQQFLVHVRVFADLGDDRGGLVGQVAGLGVDERELPFDTDGRPVRTRRSRSGRPYCARTDDTAGHPARRRHRWPCVVCVRTRRAVDLLVALRRDVARSCRPSRG